MLGLGALGQLPLGGLPLFPLVPPQSTATFEGTGSLSVLASIIPAPRVAFNGVGSLSVKMIPVLAVNAQLKGAGKFCIQAIVRKGRRGPATNVSVTGPGVTNNIRINGTV